MHEDLKYSRIIRFARAVPWAIVPERLVDIMEVLEFQARGGKLSEDEVAVLIAMEGRRQGELRSRTVGDGAVQVIPLTGILAPKAEQVNNISGPQGTSTEQFVARVRQALADPNVGSVVLDIDSPGGSTDGVQEAAEAIYGMRGEKPIVAVANHLAASAAYWIGTQADEMVVTPSGGVGSIGVFAAHSDLSAQYAARGEKVSLIYAGKYKVEGHPFGPLSDEGRDFMQNRVQERYKAFLDAVARGRDVSVRTVRDGYGEGRTVSASAALSEGMVDRIDTLEGTIQALCGPRRRRRSRAEAMPSPAAFEFLTGAS